MPDPNILPYAGRDPQAVAHRVPVTRGTVWCCVVLALVALHTCAWIEVLNGRAGGYLPRDLKGLDPGKWRQSRVVTESAWRQTQAMFQQDRTLLTRPLSAAETETMRSQIAAARRMNLLRDWVGGPGLSQYPLVPVVILLSIHLLTHPRPDRLHRLGSATLAVALGCGASMLYRGYFTSLGI